MSRVFIVFSAYNDKSVSFHVIKLVLICYVFIKQIGMIVYAKVHIELLFTFWFSF